MRRLAAMTMMLIAGMLIGGKGTPVSAEQVRSLQIYVPPPVPEPQLAPFVPAGPCLHGTNETQRERNRRYEAIRYMQGITTAQGQFLANTRRYAQFSELAGLPGVPFGFVLRHAATATSYLFSVKDEQDACSYTLYSDHGGVIYVASPIG